MIKVTRIKGKSPFIGINVKMEFKKRYGVYAGAQSLLRYNESKALTTKKAKVMTPVRKKLYHLLEIKNRKTRRKVCKTCKVMLNRNL